MWLLTLAVSLQQAVQGPARPWCSSINGKLRSGSMCNATLLYSRISLAMAKPVLQVYWCPARGCANSPKNVRQFQMPDQAGIRIRSNSLRSFSEGNILDSGQLILAAEIDSTARCLPAFASSRSTATTQHGFRIRIRR